MLSMADNPFLYNQWELATPAKVESDVDSQPKHSQFYGLRYNITLSRIKVVILLQVLLDMYINKYHCQLSIVDDNLSFVFDRQSLVKYF